MDNLQYDLLIEDIFKTIGKFQDDGTYAIRRDIMNRLNQCIPVAFIEHLSDFLNERGYEGDDTSIRLSDFRHVFTEWMASVNSDEMNRSLSSMDSESFPQIVDSHTSLSNSSDSFNSADVFADADFVKPMPVPLQRVRKDSFGAAAIRASAIESLGSRSASEYDESISYGTYSAYGGSPRKPLQENQSLNKANLKSNGELEQLKVQLNHTSIEYDRLLEKFERLESELKVSHQENEKLEQQKALLRSSNDNLNKELDTMNELRQHIHEKNAHIESLEQFVHKHKSEAEKAWSTVDKLRSEKDEMQTTLDSEVDQVNIWKQEHAILKASHERIEKELSTKNELLLIDLEKCRAGLTHTQKDHGIVERERDELKQTVHELEDELANRTSGEFIQFTESKLQAQTTVHQEFSINEDYLKAKDDEIDQMRATLDETQLRNRQLTDQLDTQQETIDHYKKELNCLESINKKETTHATCQTTIPIANVEAPRATNKRLTRVEKMLTMVVVLMAIIAGIEFERDVPLLLINCPGMGEITTH